jgi:uncharacterized protein (TIGR02147 family)
LPRAARWRTFRWVSGPPDVFRFRDYRAFLRALYEHKKKSEYGFSLRAFSKRAGLRSSNYLKLVMDGDRNLTPEMAARFAAACGLSGQASEYFCELSSFNQARHATAREQAYARLRRFRRYRKAHRLDPAQEAYYGQWYIPAIRELCARPDFREDAKWIGRTLTPKVAPRDVQRAISVLLDLGLLARDAQGRLVQSEALVETAEGALSHHVVSFHRAMLERAGEALDSVPREEREITSLTLCLSEAQLSELKQRLTRLREELLHVFQSDADAQRVVQLNFQLFPLSKKES